MVPQCVRVFRMPHVETGERNERDMKRTILLAIVTLLVAAVAIAQPASPRPGQVVAKYLQLTPDQVSAWQQINKDTAAVVQPLAANARDLRSQLDAALNAATPDPASIGQLAVSLHAVQALIRSARQSAQNQRLAVLNADQRAKFAAFQAAAQFIRQLRKPAR